LTDLISKNLENYSKAEIQRNIENYGVFVNGKLVFNRLEWVLENSSVSLETWPKREKADFSGIEILFENKDVLVIFKPKNLVVQVGAGHIYDTLETWLKHKYPQQNCQLVHRLDKDTQGLLIIAKNMQVKEFLQSQFKKRMVVKKYLALVQGLMTENYILKTYQTRDKLKILRQKMFWDEKTALEYDDKSRLGISIFKPIYICEETGQTLVEINLKTGRTHQIRLQAEAINHPLVDDKTYNQKQTFNNANPQKIKTISIAKNLTPAEFDEKIKTIFRNSSYCLLSNCLKIRLPNKIFLDIELFDF
jgi:23S rRNA pseudouridine1911/1915/1917 synthase